MDANGNTLVWDIDNHLKSFNSVTFAYDAIGRRLEKSDGTNSTLFISDGQRVIEEYSEAGGAYNLERSYVYGNYVDDLVAKVEAVNTPTVLYYHSDRQFNVRGLTDSSGAIKELYAYSVYGKQTIIDPTSSFILSNSSFNNAYGFTGRYLDIETGLWYFRARYFSDEMGRFISRDPLGYVDGMSLYNGYFAQVFGVDPRGRKSKKSVTFVNDSDGFDYGEFLSDIFSWNIDINEKEDFKYKCTKGECIKKLLVITHGSGFGSETDEYASMDFGNETLEYEAEEKGGKMTPTNDQISGMFSGFDFCDECTIEIRSCEVGNAKSLIKTIESSTGCSVVSYCTLIDPFGNAKKGENNNSKKGKKNKK